MFWCRSQNSEQGIYYMLTRSTSYLPKSGMRQRERTLHLSQVSERLTLTLVRVQPVLSKISPDCEILPPQPCMWVWVSTLLICRDGMGINKSAGYISWPTHSRARCENNCSHSSTVEPMCKQSRSCWPSCHRGLGSEIKRQLSTSPLLNQEMQIWRGDVKPLSFHLSTSSVMFHQNQNGLDLWRS